MVGILLLISVLANIIQIIIIINDRLSARIHLQRLNDELYLAEGLIYTYQVHVDEDTRKKVEDLHSKVVNKLEESRNA